MSTRNLDLREDTEIPWPPDGPGPFAGAAAFQSWPDDPSCLARYSRWACSHRGIPGPTTGWCPTTNGTSRSPPSGWAGSSTSPSMNLRATSAIRSPWFSARHASSSSRFSWGSFGMPASLSVGPVLVVPVGQAGSSCLSARSRSSPGGDGVARISWLRPEMAVASPRPNRPLRGEQACRVRLVRQACRVRRARGPVGFVRARRACLEPHRTGGQACRSPTPSGPVAPDLRQSSPHYS